MGRMYRVVVASLVLALGCAGDKQDIKEAEPDATSNDAASTAAPARTTTAKPTSDPSQGGDDAREISATDCHQLALKYGDVLRADEVAKLPEKLTEAQRAAAKRSLDDASAKLEARWEGGCVNDLVGKYASESGLRCAMASKSVAGFEACINGPPAPPPEKP